MHNFKDTEEEENDDDGEENSIFKHPWL